MYKSYKRQSGFANKMEPDEFGYTSIYRGIIRQVFPSKRLEDFTIWLLAPIALVFVFALTNATNDYGFQISNVIQWTAVMFMFFSFLVIGFGWGIGFISFALLAPPPPLAWLVARIVIAVRSPHQDRFGLTTSEIKYLLSIAEADQAAADWKGGFLTIGILSLLLAVIQSSFTDIAVFLDTYVFTPSPTSSPLISLMVTPVFWGWALITSFIMMFSISIFRPLGEYLVIEPINRAVINACHEALALLEAKGLDKRASLKLTEKKLIAKACDCMIISHSEEKDYAFLGNQLFRDENNEAWLILPPIARGKSTLWIVRIRRKLTQWIQQIINRFQI